MVNIEQPTTQIPQLDAGKTRQYVLDDPGLTTLQSIDTKLRAIVELLMSLCASAGAHVDKSVVEVLKEL
jgi:hypothetical protein